MKLRKLINFLLNYKLLVEKKCFIDIDYLHIEIKFIEDFPFFRIVRPLGKTKLLPKNVKNIRNLYSDVVAYER